MARVIADSSALVSIGTVAAAEPDPFSLCLEAYVIPTEVVTELEEIGILR